MKRLTHWWHQRVLKHACGITSINQTNYNEPCAVEHGYMVHVCTCGKRWQDTRH